ncbi:MAG: MMPL family transporter [Elusimicrobiota bacterium]
MKFGESVLRFRWPILLGCALVLGVCLHGAGRLRASVDPHDYFAEDDPKLLEVKKLEDTYAKDLNVIFVLAPPGGTVFTRETLEAVRWLTDEGWRLPLSSRVDSLTNYQHTEVDGDELLVEDLADDPEALDAEGLCRVREIALSEPSLIDRIVSKSGHVTAVSVNIVKREETLEEEVLVTEHVRRLAAEFRKRYPELPLRLTGTLIWNAAFREAAQADLGFLIPLMLGVMAAVILLLLRSLAAMLVTMLVIGSSALTAMGVGGLLGIPLGDATSAVPPIVMTLAVADSIHILTTLFQKMADGMDRRAAIVESLRINLPPVTLTSVTTAVGFLSLNFSDAPPFHDLGNLVAVGILSALAYSVLLMPALLSFIPLRPRAKPKPMAALADAVGSFVLRRRTLVLWAMGAFILLLSAGMARIEFDDNFIEYMDESIEFRRDTDFTEKNLSGLDQLEYSLESGEEGGISEPAYLKKVEEFADWLRGHPEVRYVTSINDVMKKLNKTMHGGAPEWYRVPESRELAAQYLLLYEMSLPFGLSLTDQVNLDKSASRLVANVADMSSTELSRIEKDANRWLRENAPAPMRARASGLSVLFAHITENNIQSMLFGTGAALILISVLLVFAFRSLRIGLVSLVPNLVPAAMTFGLWGFTVGRVGLASSVVAAMTLGIVVDDTIHFLSKYLRALREMKLSRADAIRFSFHTVGTAMFYTSVILVSGFLILALSSFLVNRVMGLLSAIAIIFALLADFLFLPALLLKTRYKTK